jgi:hypothetical protein
MGATSVHVVLDMVAIRVSISDSDQNLWLKSWMDRERLHLLLDSVTSTKWTEEEYNYRSQCS